MVITDVPFWIGAVLLEELPDATIFEVVIDGEAAASEATEVGEVVSAGEVAAAGEIGVAPEEEDVGVDMVSQLQVK